MTTNEERKVFEDDPISYMMIGDTDKPFHRPECECEDCEGWRTRNNRPTHEQLRKNVKEVPSQKPTTPRELYKQETGKNSYRYVVVMDNGVECYKGSGETDEYIRWLERKVVEFLSRSL